MSNKKRETFTSKTGFILSCIGAAIGLGNVWMFPYRLGQNGGAVFLIPYFIFVFIFGTTGLITEFSFGRWSQSGPLQGIKKIFKEKGLKFGGLFGVIPVIGLGGIFLFYNVVVGWIIKYFFLSLTGQFDKIDISNYFGSFVGTPETVFWNFIAVALTLIIILLGVTKGIEKINSIIMPSLFIIFILLAIRSLTLPGAIEGVKYLLTPQWEYLFRLNTWVMALGQAFFSVSLTGCGMVVYGSYLKKDVDIPRSAILTALLDTVAALLAAFVIMPAVFAFKLDPAAGPSLLFITLPTIFKHMPLGGLLATLFFLSIFFAAISSSISMLEGPVEALMSQTKLTRKKAAVLLASIGFILAIPLDLNMDAFGKFADLMSVVISPIGAVIVFIVFYYICDSNRALEEINLGASKKLGQSFMVFAKYGFVIVSIAVIVLGIVYGGIG
jgi:NSS family neurotransmitter:Na+ symporter